MIDAQQAIMQREAVAIDRAARVITDSLRQGGALHLVGSGHSHLPVEEAFYRSGGLATAAILDEFKRRHGG